jgi:hypothetical protein
MNSIIAYILIITLFETKNLKNGVPLPQAKLSTMKYYRFSRRRKNYLGFSDYFRSKKKSDYMNQAWGALHKAWKDM